jgi:PIN domain nuclease of toxin-antitoxin system
MFIWWADEHERLSEKTVKMLENENNRLFLSLVSVWEMQIKIQLGKMKLNLPLKELIESQEKINGLKILSITREHIFALAGYRFITMIHLTDY